MRKIVLIGTSHNYQVPRIEPYAAVAERFRQLLQDVCYKHEAKALAEELHPDEIARRGAITSVAYEVADELGLRHQYSDLSDAERESRGYSHQHSIWTNCWMSAPPGASKDEIDKLAEPLVHKNHAIKEHHWLDNLLKLDTWPAVFICGADHCEHFGELVGKNHIQLIIAFPDWSPSAQY